MRCSSTRLKSVCTNLGNEAIYKQLNALISYLGQQNLIGDMKYKAPKVSDTNRESMGGVSKWFHKYKIPIHKYIQEKQPSCAPSNEWCIFTTHCDYFTACTNVLYHDMPQEICSERSLCAFRMMATRICLVVMPQYSTTYHSPRFKTKSSTAK